MNTQLLISLPVSNILTPHDDYSSQNSSAIATVVCELGRVHIARGGQWNVIGTQDKRNDYGVGTVQEVIYPPLLRTRFHRTDQKLAVLGLPRYFGRREFSPSRSAFSPDHQGPIFIHNCEPTIPILRRHLPKASLFLWMHNEFRFKMKKAEARKMLAPLDGIVCVSQYIASFIRGIAGEDICPLYVLHNGVNTQTFAPRIDAQQRDVDGMPTVLFVGNLAHKKGLHLLVEAAEILAQEKKSFRMRFIGSARHGDPTFMSGYERDLRGKSARLNQFIEWGGYKNRHEIAQEYANASVFCAPAIWNDPCPLVILEGMASGCAVVTTRRGGIPEIGGDAVLYFERDNAQSLAQVLAKLLNDADLRADYGRKARERALLFSWEKQYDKLCDSLPFLAQG